MRKLLLVFGGIYILIGIYGLSFIPQLWYLHDKANTQFPYYSVGWVLSILLFGILNLLFYFSKSKSKLIQYVLISIAVLGFVLYLIINFYIENSVGIMINRF